MSTIELQNKIEKYIDDKTIEEHTDIVLLSINSNLVDKSLEINVCLFCDNHEIEAFFSSEPCLMESKYESYVDIMLSTITRAVVSYTLTSLKDTKDVKFKLTKVDFA